MGGHFTDSPNEHRRRQRVSGPPANDQNRGVGHGCELALHKRTGNIRTVRPVLAGGSFNVGRQLANTQVDNNAGMLRCLSYHWGNSSPEPSMMNGRQRRLASSYPGRQFVISS